MDLADFLFLIEERKLHFSRLDQLDDKLEGSLGAVDVMDRKREFEREVSSKGTDILQKYIPYSIKSNRKFFFVNCWTRNPHECSAYWQAYVEGKGVAIQSSVGH